MSHAQMIIAVAQVDASRQAGAARMQWLEQQLQLATQQGVELMVLPELFVSGYHTGPRVEQLAETADGPTAKAIMALAQTYQIAIHYGFAERQGQGEEQALYNAAQCIGPCGNVLGHYRKRVLPPGFEATYFTKGHACNNDSNDTRTNDTGLFSFRGFSIGMLICYDAEFPELTRKLALKGADIILVPTALGSKWGWVARQMMPTRGYENGVYFVYANYCGAQNNIAFLGESFIASPLGHVAIRAGSEEALIVAQVSLDDVHTAQKRLPYLQDCQGL